MGAPSEQIVENLSSTVSVMVVAGEASSDEHAAHVVYELKQKLPQAEVFGMGGSSLRAVGAETIVDSEQVASVMGLTEVIGSLWNIYVAYRTLVQEAERRKPKLVILVDFPDFNMQIARALHRRGAKILYFISPQLWAWRKGRIRTMKKYVDIVAPIFPFEESFYHRHGMQAEYVGHPFLDRPAMSIDRDVFLSEQGLDPARPVVALLPGSRKAEVERLAPVMSGALRRLRKIRPGVQAIVPIARTLKRDWVKSFFDETLEIAFVDGRSSEVVHAADVGIIASGTATVEAALARLPMVIVYKLSPVTYRVGRMLVRGVKFFGMANLIAGEQVVPELLQDDVNEARLCEELERYLGDPAHRAKTAERLGRVRQRLALPGTSRSTAAGRTADIAYRICTEELQQ